MKVFAPGTCVRVKAGGAGGKSTTPAFFKASADTVELPGVLKPLIGAERLPEEVAAAKVIKNKGNIIV
jgi:hypothetical protein